MSRIPHLFIDTAGGCPRMICNVCHNSTFLEVPITVDRLFAKIDSFQAGHANCTPHTDV